MPPRTHIFVCYSALSFDAAVRIAAGGELEDGRLVFLLLFPANRLAIPANAATYEMVPPPATYSEWTRPFQIARWFHGVLDALKASLDRGRVTAYIPHPFELPGNYFAFTEGAADRLELLPDGLINYSKRSLDPENKWMAVRYGVRVRLRIIAAALHGLSYRRLAPGHITQFETVPYERTWCISEEGLLTQRGVIQKIPENRDAPKRNESLRPATLFLDQELPALADRTLEEKLRIACENVLMGTSRGDVVLYKAHPRGRNRAAELKSRGIELQDISAPELAEHVIPAWNVTRLVGFYSTPLVLLAADPKLHRVAIFPSAKARGIQKRRMAEEVRQALQAAKVELIEID